MLSVDFNMFFSFKCLVYKYPLMTQLVLTGTITIVMALLYQTLEGNITDRLNPIDFYDAIWVVFIIITTVGFGDIYAITNLGRLVMVINSLVGIFLVSLIIMSLQKEIQLDIYESKAFDLVARLQAKEETKKTSAAYLNFGMKYLVAKKKYLRHNKKASSYNFTRDENELKYLLNNRLQLKNQLKNQINLFFRNFEPYHEGDTIRKRLKDINERLCNLKKNEDSNQNKFEKLVKLFELMENRNFIKDYIHNKNESFTSSKFTSNW